jgi:hypothetical protein
MVPQTQRESRQLEELFADVCSGRIDVREFVQEGKGESSVTRINGIEASTFRLRGIPDTGKTPF